MKFIQQLLVNTLLLFTTVSYCFGSDHIEVVTEDWPPFNYLLADGQVGGRNTAVVRHVLEKAKLKYSINLYPWARSYEMAKNHKNTLVYSILRTPERENLFKWICPIGANVNLYMYVLAKRTNLPINTIEDAKQYLVGVTRGDYPHIRLTELGFNEKNLLVSPSDDVNVKMLINSRIDFVVEAEDTMETILKSIGKDKSVVRRLFTINLNNSAENCMAFGLKTDDAIVNRVRQALIAINSDRANINNQPKNKL